MNPRQMPELRSALIEHYHDPAVIAWWAKREAPPAMEFFDQQTGTRIGRMQPAGDQVRRAEVRSLEQASLFYVTSGMTDLAAGAAVSLPSFVAEASDVPARYGLMIFEKPIWEEKDQFGRTVFISGVTWHVEEVPMRSHDGEITRPPLPPVLWVSCYLDHHMTMDAGVADGLIDRQEADFQKSHQPRYTYSSEAAIWLGMPIDQMDSIFNLWGKTVLSAWLLMRQTLARITEFQPDRATRRRLQGTPYEPPPVKIIELRRPENSKAATGMSDREYHHQWIVRGHWRQQACGLGRTERRPTWITPHIKGPEGAPMLGGEKVYALKR